MKIKLNNIGIVSNSTMSLDGLTIITGKNNSGKTTVGKALYSLLDAVSNILVKFRNDRRIYIAKKLDDVTEALDLFRIFVQFLGLEENPTNESPINSYPAIQELVNHEYRHNISQSEIESFAHKLQDEITRVDIDELCNTNFLKYYVNHMIINEEDERNTSKIISEQLRRANAILTELFSTLEKDPQLIEYTRESINQTLNLEFSGQIQPVLFDVGNSKIELYDDDTCCFNVNIVNNKVVNDGKPVFFTSPYKKVFFVDNPFVLDESVYSRIFLRNRIDTDPDSLLNANNIISHNTKLRNTLRTKKQPTILEQTILNESLKKVKNEIDSIVPGSFEFSPNGDFYVQNGTKLKVSNLATGSKMFSIIKILIEKGELGDSTMLILDEPEAHLHPSWQNHFAEMIVLLVKELRVNILLTTHSSNFVLALDAYMRKHEIEEKTNFYRTDFTDSGMINYVCANDDIGSIYQDFLQYFSEVKMLRNNCLRNVGDES